MSWITHVMVVDDDARVLESLVPNLALELKKLCEKSAVIRGALGRAGSEPIGTRISAYGFDCARARGHRSRAPLGLHLHMVREEGGRFEVARRLLNQQLFGVVVSDLRFSDDAGGQRAGKLFVEEIARVHPETVGLLYSAYPRPEGFPQDRFARKGGEDADEPSLARLVVQHLEAHFENAGVGAFAQAVNQQGLEYESGSFGETLSQVYSVARLVAGNSTATRGPGRRPLPCVLLDGESGTGKRGLATVFHAASDRRRGPLVVASCNDLTNETLLRSILFGHKRGAFTDAREERQGLVTAAGHGVLLLDDFHRLPPACSAIVHSFLEDGEFSRLGEEEVRRNADCAVVLTVESGPWRERRRSGELPLAFLARVERLPVQVAPLRERPEDIGAQAVALLDALGRELGVELTMTDAAYDNLKVQPFADSNSRELRNVIEQAVYRNYKETDEIDWAQIEPFLGEMRDRAGAPSRPVQANEAGPRPALNEWQKRLRGLASKIMARGMKLDTADADRMVDQLFDQAMPQAWSAIESARTQAPDGPSIPMPVWEDVWRCFAVNWLGGPTPAEKVLGIPANTLRQWINDREGRS